MVEQHIAVDASEAPEVLVFEVGAIAVFIHLDGNLIVTLLEIAGDVELRGFHGTLRVTHLLAINPDIEGRHDTLEAQESLPRLPPSGEGEGAPILTCGIALLVGGPLALRFAHHIGRVDLKRIACRDVDRCAKAMVAIIHLPVGWNGKLDPTAVVEVGAIEVLDAPLGCLRPSELPLAIER